MAEEMSAEQLANELGPDIQVMQLTGCQISQAVAEIMGTLSNKNLSPKYHSSWYLSGPIIEDNHISIEWEERGQYWTAFWASSTEENAVCGSAGDTPLEAALRCFILRRRLYPLCER